MPVSVSGSSYEKHSIILSLGIVCLIANLSLLQRPLQADPPESATVPTRGIAVLASSLGKDMKPEELAQIVERGKYSPVVVDWAWITAHWNRTDFAAVNKFLRLMVAQKVPVAAMYRPRFIANPTVATQMKEDGKRADDHAEICYSDPAARRWGFSWGEKILEKCPGFREIVIYNPGSYCKCPACAEADKKGQFSAVKEFLVEARAAWKAKQPAARLGVVYVTDPEFWKETLEIVDVAHPYLGIREEIDPVQEVEKIQKIRSIVQGKMGSCLGKVTWEENAKVTIEKLKAFDDAAAAGEVSYFFWTYDTLFQSNLYNPNSGCRGAIDRFAMAYGGSEGQEERTYAKEGFVERSHIYRRQGESTADAPANARRCHLHAGANQEFLGGGFFGANLQSGAGLPDVCRDASAHAEDEGQQCGRAEFDARWW